MLQPIPDKNKVLNTTAELPEITRVCENCATSRESSCMINCIIVIGSPGHASMAPFQCPNEEHWACSLDCWIKVAHACIDEHMIEVLKELHKQKGLL